MIEFYALTALLLKHTVFDYFVQTGYMIKDKADYGAKGGLLHGALHGVGTFIALAPFVSVSTAFLCAVADTIVHYHIDYVKSNIMRQRQPNPAQQEYWVLHGIDQLLHTLTYVAIVWLVTFP